MKTSTTPISVLAFLILLTVTALAATARATVRIDARIDAPGLHVRVGGPRISTVDLCLGGHGTRIHEHDRRVARRLARYAGVPVRRMLQMKRHGHCWSEIGRAFDLPRAAVRAAQSADRWSDYLRHGRCGLRARPTRRHHAYEGWCGTHARTRNRGNERCGR